MENLWKNGNQKFLVKSVREHFHGGGRRRKASALYRTVFYFCWKAAFSAIFSVFRVFLRFKNYFFLLLTKFPTRWWVIDIEKWW